MTSDLAPLEYPRMFRGVFERTRHTYGPLLEDARAAVDALAVPRGLRPYLDYVVRENPQPSFMLLPLMFLLTAEASGGVREVHRRTMPVLLLAMEAIAVADDTVDRTPRRSGRPTFPARFGERSTVPFTASLVSLVVRQALQVDPRVVEHLSRFFLSLCADELWESQNLYPAPEAFERWLDNRYAQSVEGAAGILDLALALNDHAPLPRAAYVAYGSVFQDVDDVVNVVEERAAVGENDDISMGMVTFPLLHTLRERPELVPDLVSSWARRRDDHTSPAAPPPARLREAVRAVGVPATVARVLQRCRAAVRASPPSFQPTMRDFVTTFADRLCRCDGLLTPAQVERALGPDLLVTDAS